MRKEYCAILALVVAACGSESSPGDSTANSGTGGAATSSNTGTGPASTGTGGSGNSGASNGTTVTGGTTSGSSGVTTGSSGVGGSSPVQYQCAQSIIVATTGDDNNPGTEASPLKTISVATQKANAGDCVSVHAGTYHEVLPITFMQDGTASAPIVLLSVDGPRAAIIDASGNLTDPMIIVTHDHIVIDGFVIENMPTDTMNQPIHFDGQLMHKGNGSVVRQCKISGGYDQLKVNQAAAGILVELCEFSGIFGHIGISITGVVGMTLRANYFHDWASDGNGSIQVKGGSSNVVLDGNLFANITGDSGVVALGDGCDDTCDIDPEHYANVAGAVINNVMINVPRAVDFGGCKNCLALNNTIIDSATGSVAFKLVPATTNGTTQECVGAQIMNNILYNSSATLSSVMQINSMSGTGLMMDNNLYYNGGSAIPYGDTHPATADVHSITADPKLVNASGTTAVDFKLQPSSPAIDKGSNVGAEDAHDFASVGRPQGAGYDIGAFEQ